MRNTYIGFALLFTAIAVIVSTDISPSQENKVRAEKTGFMLVLHVPIPEDVRNWRELGKEALLVVGRGEVSFVTDLGRSYNAVQKQVSFSISSVDRKIAAITEINPDAPRIASAPQNYSLAREIRTTLIGLYNDAENLRAEVGNIIPRTTTIIAIKKYVTANLKAVGALAQKKITPKNTTTQVQPTPYLATTETTTESIGAEQVLGTIVNLPVVNQNKTLVAKLDEDYVEGTPNLVSSFLPV